MATKNTQSRKPMSSGAKGAICLVILLAITVCACCLSVMGMNLDAEGVNVLLPWVPVSSAKWPVSLPVSMSLGGGTYAEYAYKLNDDAAESALNDSVNTIRARLAQMGESDAVVALKDDAVRVELRKMDASRLASLRNMAIMGGQFVFADTEGNTVLTEKDVTKADVSVNYLNANRTSYTVSLAFTLTKDAQAKLAETNPSYLSVTCDGDSVSSYGLVDGDKITCSVGSTANAYNTAANLAFLVNYGAVDMTLNLRDSGDVAASSGMVLTVVLIVLAAMLVFALLYLLCIGKLTGLSAFLGILCAVVLNLFFVASIIVPTEHMLNVGCLAAILLGVLLAVYAAVTRTDAISKQIKEGNAPKSATKQGFSAAAKNVWLVHACVLAVALILMIFAFSKSIGYVLASGVVASAIATVIMRAFQFCFTMISNKPSLFGKAK